MSSHRLPDDFNRFLATSGNVVADPGSNGTFDLTACPMFGMATIASGTRKLPDNMPLGTKFYVYATGSVTITNAAGTTVLVLAAEQIGEFTAKTSTTWVGTSQAVGGDGLVDAGGYTTATTVEAALQEIYASLNPVTPVQTNITTVGNGTLTAASIVGGFINRTGSTADYTDTTATAAQIGTSLGTGVRTNTNWILLIRNTVAFSETLVGGTDVTLAGNTVVPPNSVGVFQVDYDPLSPGVTLTGLGAIAQASLPNSKFTTNATDTTITAAAGTLTGAGECFYATTAAGAGGIALTTRTATQMFADTPNAHIGLSWIATIISDGGGTVTLTAGTGVTITGTATVATNTWRRFRCTFTSATAVTMQAVQVGTIDSTT